MKFKYIGKAVDTQAYGYTGLNPGDEIELNDHFSVKATFNPDFEQVRASKSGRKAPAPKADFSGAGD